MSRQTTPGYSSGMPRTGPQTVASSGLMVSAPVTGRVPVLTTSSDHLSRPTSLAAVASAISVSLPRSRAAARPSAADVDRVHRCTARSGRPPDPRSSRSSSRRWPASPGRTAYWSSSMRSGPSPSVPVSALAGRTRTTLPPASVSRRASGAASASAGPSSVNTSQRPVGVGRLGVVVRRQTGVCSHSSSGSFGSDGMRGSPAAAASWAGAGAGAWAPGGAWSQYSRRWNG